MFTKHNDETPTRVLARFAAELPVEAVPAPVLHEAKRLFLDGLGCALGGYTLDAGRFAIAGLSRWRSHGRAGATVVGDGNRLSSVHAAYLNAKLRNLMDMDEVLFNITHLSPVVPWSALVLAEEEDCSGQELLTAYTLGFEAGARVFLALGTIFEIRDGRPAPWHTTGFGQAIIGGAAACGRILRLPPERMDRFALGDGFSPAHRLDDEAVIAKFRRNAEAVFPDAAIARLIDAVFHLESVTSLSALTRDLCVPAMEKV